MLRNVKRLRSMSLLVFSIFSLFMFIGCGTDQGTISTNATPNPTTNPTSFPTSQTSITPQPTVNPEQQEHSIPSKSTDPPYTTPNGTVICAGDVSVVEPNGTRHDPVGDSTIGEEVAISASGYTIIFTNSASCHQYPLLTSSQINSMLDNIEAQQRSGGCGGHCTGTEQRWVFP